jgi:hypothetical protein
MSAFDRLGWAGGVAFRVCGLRIGVRVSERSALAELPGILPPGWRPAASPIVDHLYSWIVGGAGGRSLHLLYSDATRLARTRFQEDVLGVLRNDVGYQVASGARSRVFLHAGAVAFEGRALLLPGPSGAGKSHLVEALVEAGASYLSDEYAPLDARGRVHPYPVPGALLAVAALRRPLPVAGVLVVRYREGAGCRLHLLSPGQGLLRMLQSAVPVRHDPERTVAALARITTSAPVLVGVRGEARGCIPRVLDWFASDRDRRQVA